MTLRIALAALLFGAASSALACSCVISDPKTSFKRADAVFVAEVVEYSEPTARLRVIERFKGAPSETIEIVTPESSAACGYGSALTPGSRHLFYALKHELMPYLEVSSCSRSQPVEHASCDLAFLRSRAAWWRSRLSSMRIFDRLGIRWDPCRPTT